MSQKDFYEPTLPLPSHDIGWNEVIKPSNWKNLNILRWIMKEPGTFFLFKNRIHFPTKKISYNCSNGIKLFNCTPFVILFLMHRNSYGGHAFVPLILKPYTTINFKQQINQFENIIKYLNEVLLRLQIEVVFFNNSTQSLLVI